MDKNLNVDINIGDEIFVVDQFNFITKRTVTEILPAIISDGEFVGVLNKTAFGSQTEASSQVVANRLKQCENCFRRFYVENGKAPCDVGLNCIKHSYKLMHEDEWKEDLQNNY